MDLPAVLRSLVNNNSAMTLLFVALGMACWLIGGNVLVAFHYRRIGKPLWSGLRPFAFPFAHFNAQEWVFLIVLLVVSLSLFAVGLSFGGQ